MGVVVRMPFESTISQQMKVHHIYLSPRHNFVGRWGKGAAGQEMVEVEAVTCAAGRGLVGDRYFDHRPDYKGQITFFSMEVFAEMCRELALQWIRPSSVRRNVFVSGVDLNAFIGQTFEVQGLGFEGTESCAPCDWMELAVGEGARDFLEGRGGLRCRILSDGVLRCDA
ncbi:MAG: molybdenum cofactor biosysynthesis protein [Puniceicoccaceae bacterium]